MSTSSVMLWICKIPRFVSPWQTNVLPTIIHADKIWIQDIIWVIVVPIACFWLVWSSLSRELFWTLFQTKSLIYFIEIANKISSFKNSFKKNGFSCKKVWKIKLLSHWDHAWFFWWGIMQREFHGQNFIDLIGWNHHT